jgi:hypothetical protein
MEHRDSQNESALRSEDSPKQLEVIPTGSDESLGDFKTRERRVPRTLDLYVAPLMGAFNFISYIDRSNIGFAATQGMNEDIHLKGTDLNVLFLCLHASLRLADLNANRSACLYSTSFTSCQR